MSSQNRRNDSDIYRHSTNDKYGHEATDDRIQETE
jgi:hypothetical protein